MKNISKTLELILFKALFVYLIYLFVYLFIYAMCFQCLCEVVTKFFPISLESVRLLLKQTNGNTL